MDLHSPEQHPDHDVQPIQSGSDLWLLEGVSPVTPSIKLKAAEKCYVKSAIGISPFLRVPEAFIYDAPNRSHSSLLEFT